jgi:hypothetical protein
MLYGNAVPRFFNWSPLGPSNGAKEQTAFPAAQAPYFVVRESAWGFTSRQAAQRGNHVEVRAPGESEPLFSTRINKTDARCYFVPQAKLLILVGSRTPNQIDLFFVDVDAALRKRRDRYLFLKSSPPLQTRAGTKFRYAAAFISSHPDVHFELDQAPAGMTVDAKGMVDWEVPKEHPAAYVDFRLVATLAPGLVREQWISLYCHE